MKIKIKKTDWMRPADLAKVLGTSPQNINYMKLSGKIDAKIDKYGFTLVRGK